MKTAIEIGFNEYIFVIHPNKKRFKLLPKTDGTFELKEYENYNKANQEKI
jgi:hypothetical protein